VQGQDILKDKLGRITARAVIMPFYIEPNHIPTFSQEAFRPAAKAAEEIDAQWLHASPGLYKRVQSCTAILTFLGFKALIPKPI
jgi:hypothetical protein